LRPKANIARSEAVTSLPQLVLQNISRADLLDYFDNSWNLTEVLFSSLEESAFYRAPYHQLRHPLIFYYAHPAVLYINKLRVAGLLGDPVDAYFEQIFEVGVDEMSWDDMSKNEMQWPALEDVIRYRQSVYQLIKHLIKSHPDLDPGEGFPQHHPGWALAMGCEHERIHLETSSVLIRELPLKFLRKPSRWPSSLVASRSHPANEWFSVASTRIDLGKPADEPTFGWDNEYGFRTAQVPAFEVSRYLISNREFLEFVVAGGYREAAHWSATGWRWRQFRNSKWPTFWVPDGPAGLNRFKLRTLFELLDFQESWPAIVNFHEAQAYCNWRTDQDRSAPPVRLPTEAEQHSLRKQAPPEHGWNCGLIYGSESPVDAHLSTAGVGDVFGNVWQWSADTFNPLPGFRAHRYYEDFSLPCFDGQHQMIFGGSFISTGDLASERARFHFRPHFFQHAGFRICRDLARIP
jgi:5-histidylcysteine sulfoxide synthase